MPIEIAVQHRDGGQTGLTVWPSTEVAFEDHFDVVWSEAFGQEHVPQKYLYFVAYHAAKDAGKAGDDFQEWLRTVAEVSIKADTAGPLDQARAPGS
jgi:hypothetical protein